MKTWYSMYASLCVYLDYSITSRMYFNIIVSIYADINQNIRKLY